MVEQSLNPELNCGELQKGLLKEIVRGYTNFKKAPKDRRVHGYLSSRLKMLDDDMKTARVYHQAIIGGGKLEQNLKEEELVIIFDQIQDIYLEYRTELVEAMEPFSRSSVVAAPTLASTSTPLAKTNQELRLPKIDIPKFSGSYTTWRSFHDLFSALVHNNASLNTVEKLHYLKSSLSGEAERLIQHLPLDSGNYKKAWELLTSRYDHKRVLVNAQLKMLFSQPVLTRESANGLKELLDTSQECIHALANLGLPTEHWGTILIYVLFHKLPSSSQQLWEEKLGNTKELPTFTEFTGFLETRFRTLEGVDQQDPKAKPRPTADARMPKVFFTKPSKRPSAPITCRVCHQGQHSVRKCQRFLNMEYLQRREAVKRAKVCENCLGESHLVRECPSTKSCFFCQQRHHSLLHASQVSQHTNRTDAHTHGFESATTSYPRSANNRAFQGAVNHNAPAFQPSGEAQASTSATLNTFHASQGREISKVLLATAVVKVIGAEGRFYNLRALIDPGSEATFITEAAAQLLKLKKHRTFVEVSGLGMVSSGTSQSYVDILFESLHSTYKSSARALVFKSLTGRLPAQKMILDKWSHLHGLFLADPQFGTPAPIDLLFGNDVFADIILPDIVRGTDPCSPLAQKSLLGWIVFGKVPAESPQRLRSFSQFVDLNKQLERFWQIEEMPFQAAKSQEDIVCEEHFVAHTTRLANGRYEVKLPFKESDYPKMGCSRGIAVRRFAHLERRFATDPQLHEAYSKCIQEYATLGHMEEVNADDPVLNTPYHYFLPHHAVIKDSSSTTRLRVVFDAAAKTSDGLSLNERLLVGPKLQTDIVDLILRWRTHRITFVADIEKMYRQISISPLDRYYQLIVWRDRRSTALKIYKLNTVTFGTATAPYLALRVLKRLADDEAHRFQVGSQVIRDDMYVDDLISGADSLEEAKRKRDEARRILSTAGFNLRKWASNHKSMMEGIPEKDREMNFELPFDTTSHIKTLGIKWFPLTDTFSFQNIQSRLKENTKRSLLSVIAKLYDPLGWISPCVVTTKILMQQLWTRGTNWDEPISEDLLAQWEAFQRELPMLENIKIPRWINTRRNIKGVELHGFCDASIKAYGAALYIRVLDQHDDVHMHLLISKTKVAPTKRVVTLPRLELCGAVVLATLIKYAVEVLGIAEIKVYAWTDSNIALAWIRAPPSKWTTFVANRVSEIQRQVDTEAWRHVPTLHNPADLASRGALPSKLHSLEFWWKGPTFLREQWHFKVPDQPLEIDTQEEKRAVKVHCAQGVVWDAISQVIHRCSRLSKIVRIVASCLRFVSNCKSKKGSRDFNPLTPEELDKSHLLIVKAVQKEMFSVELEEISKDGTSKQLRPLCAFVDEQGVLRVGGRLQNSLLSYQERHPIILRHNHHLTKLIVQDAHTKTFHGGLQQTVAYIRRSYWISQVNRCVKYHLHRCSTCFRQKAKGMQQLMGNLPAARVRMAKPFSNTGVDYAGPIEIKAWKGRGGKVYKGYIALFICMVTKAIHLEVVSDMSTPAFLAAFRRFVARRGACAHVHSDCGTNFVGANAELGRMLKEAKHEWKDIAEELANKGVTWHFIPPASPHFGGLWEAGVKSVKYHLKRIVGNERLTFEELSTLLAQIEACLNSRPLCPLSDSIDNLDVITPGHFLVGEALQSIPQGDSSNKNISCLERWKRLQVMVDSFWKKWSSEYLTRLQQRPKWARMESTPKVGDLVLLKDERLPPTQWLLAKIEELHPGADGLTRVVTIKTKTGIIKRPITKICYLPVNENNENSLI